MGTRVDGFLFGGDRRCRLVGRVCSGSASHMTIARAGLLVAFRRVQSYVSTSDEDLFGAVGWAAAEGVRGDSGSSPDALFESGWGWVFVFAVVSGAGVVCSRPEADSADVRSLAEARAWRQESQVAVRRLTMRAPTLITVREAAEAWLVGAEAGLVRTRSGSGYKPSTLRTYREALRTKLLPELGHLRLSGMSLNGVQDLADRVVGEGFAPSSVRNASAPRHHHSLEARLTIPNRIIGTHRSSEVRAQLTRAPAAPPRRTA